MNRKFSYVKRKISAVKRIISAAKRKIYFAMIKIYAVKRQTSAAQRSRLPCREILALFDNYVLSINAENFAWHLITGQFFLIGPRISTN